MTSALRIDVSPEATRQIIEQADYYRLHSGSELADKWRLAVRDSALSLRNLPERGTRCHFKQPFLHDIRRIPIFGFPRHSLYYRFNKADGSIYLLDILHEARDAENILFAPEI